MLIDSVPLLLNAIYNGMVLFVLISLLFLLEIEEVPMALYITEVTPCQICDIDFFKISLGKKYFLEIDQKPLKNCPSNTTYDMILQR